MSKSVLPMFSSMCVYECVCVCVCVVCGEVSEVKAPALSYLAGRCPVFCPGRWFEPALSQWTF